MTIKVLEKTDGCIPKIIAQGDWIDLSTSEDISLRGPYSKALKRKTKNQEVVERYRDVVASAKLIPLGVCIEIPKGMEAILLPRSSTFKKWGLLQTNSMGVIDNSYSSNEDEWKLPVISTRSVFIPKGTRIAQFRIQPSQKATLWQKLKWLLSSSVKIKKVETLKNPVRGGFGSTN